MGGDDGTGDRALNAVGLDAAGDSVLGTASVAGPFQQWAILGSNQ